MIRLQRQSVKQSMAFLSRSRPNYLSATTAVRFASSKPSAHAETANGTEKSFNSYLEQLSAWFSGPKGFGRYQRKEGTTVNETESNQQTNQEKSSSDSNNSNNNKSGGSGGPNGNKNNKDPKFPMETQMMIFMGVSSIFLFAATSMMKDNGREITWQEFQTHLLDSGKVDRILVVNKTTAKVQMREFVDIDPRGRPSAGTATVNSPPVDDGRFVSVFKDPNFEAEKDQNRQNANNASRVDVASQSNPQYQFSIGNIESFEQRLEEAQKNLKIAPRDYIPVMYVNETSLTSQLGNLLPFLLFIPTLMFLRNMGGSGGGGGGGGGFSNLFRMSKSPAKKITKESVTNTFKDVAGCDEAKREIMEFVDFLKDPKRFTALGAKIPRGALLTGPPGTGKTLLAKATAGEANVPFYTVSGSDFVEMFVGVGASRVRELFKEARKESPCIIFIDEIDAIGRKRGQRAVGGNDERENTLNQLLVEMDGFDASHNVVILAGTNRVDILDPALTRPGRFDRTIFVDKPDIAGRKAIFLVHLQKITLDGEGADYASRLAALTPGFTGADIANICNEAAIQAARGSKTKVDMKDFEKATDRIIGGLESKKLISPEEKKVIAYHEAGHAIAGWNLKYADPLLKVTIVPRGGGALGFAQYLPKEVFLRTREQILDTVCMALAGRASEQVNFGNVTTGASDDLRRVTQIVYQMVQVYGMNDKIGQVGFHRDSNAEERLYSEATAEMMDEEVRGIVAEAYARTIALITEKNDQVIAVAELLLSQETITNMDVERLVGKRPHGTSAEYQEYTGDWESKKDEVPEKKEVETDDQVAVDVGAAAPQG